ncbi:hypothetical protein K2173_021384 [Erythroxylum novogranatense]|uniref:HhH-GPD domain-containing protein n=1 Tax=Erythroxylum novogranatense TaxID=1862640 RepID=A0AAV8TUP2_9ROSI|nr:hypothetical protein K2173_021384 [Erythroxylum novogranatense]
MGRPVTRSNAEPINKSSSPSQTVPKISFRSRKIRKAPAKSSTTTMAISSCLPVAKPLSIKGEIELALHHLRHSDPLLTTLLDTQKPTTFDRPFLSLARSILYQQLTSKAAKSIYTRFLELCGGESEVNPDIVLSLSAQQLREIWVSVRKAGYLHDLADKWVMMRLTTVKGIGVWSVHMFMMFSLHRPDVLPVAVGDLVVRKGVQSLYRLKDLPHTLKMEEVCEKWKPYRSVGSWYMRKLKQLIRRYSHNKW